MSLQSRIFKKLKKLFLPKPNLLKTTYRSSYRLKRLGSKYGGWVFTDAPFTQKKSNLVILSGGLGEDASFDIEFASEYDCKIFLLDPTPKAILHYNSIVDRLGKAREENYNLTGGKQLINSYPLDQIKGSMELIPFALWNETTELEFFLPTDPNHVSCSISDIQHNNRREGESIKINSIKLTELCDRYRIDKDKIDILKLDIEGAEVEVLKDILPSKIKPMQILVEYDELMFPSRRNYRRVQFVHDLILISGYKCYYSDGISCFSYILDKSKSDKL